ncbi:MAG: hypothetical protein LJE93_13990 [Acidobacteria bacterium]|nr:hypothetical protein [Acidobacteriota bacterium]
MDNPCSLRFDLDMDEAFGRRLQPDAKIVQEDRNLVMAGNGLLDLDTNDDLDSAYAAIAEHRPLPLGRYLLLRSRDNDSLWIYQAVVHDLEEKPTCRAGNVRRSLTSILKDSVKRGMTSVAVEPLGVWRGRGLTLEEMVDAFEAAVFELAVELEYPFRVTLLLEDMAKLEEVSHLLRSRLLSKGSRSFRTVDGESALVEVRKRNSRLHCRFVPGSLSGYSVTCVSPKR